MPNWCNNSVTVTHTDPTKITALAAAFAEGRFLDHVIPVPEDLKITASPGTTDQELTALYETNTARHGAANWYDFCVARWGTKWDVGGADATMDIENNGCTLSVSFESAWSPPLGVYEELRAQGYDVVAHYWESSMCFVGRWHNGDDLYYDYCGLNSETVRGYIGAELDDYWYISASMAEYEAENDETDEVQTWYEDGIEKKGLVPHETK